MILKNDVLSLRAVEPSDLDWMYLWENDPDVWQVSNTQAPFSRYVLMQFIENAHLDIYEAKQVRLMIDDRKGTTVGSLDLFDFSPLHKRAGIGILIDAAQRGKGYAQSAIELVKVYARDVLHLHQLYCGIAADNESSLAVFGKSGFSVSGTKKDWLKTASGWTDEVFLQILLSRE